MPNGLELRARRPLSYGEPSAKEPCEGRQASPSNPTKGTARSSRKSDLTSVVVFRCTPAEKQALLAKAYIAGVPFAVLLREALGLTDARRRKLPPRVDPRLVLAIARIGGNLNQIARWLNTTSIQGHVHTVDKLTVAAQLVSIERALSETLNSFSGDGDPTC